VIEHSVEEESVSDGGTNHPMNHAVHFKLTSEMMGMKKDFWLIENSPVNADANAIVMGPAHFFLKAGMPAAPKVEKPTLTIKDNNGAVIVSMAVDVPLAASVALGSTSLHIENLFYYSHAAVDGRNLIEGPDGTPDNPAVAFDIVDASGVRQHVIKFALFPNFESMHAKSGTVFPVSAEFHAPVSRPETDEASSLTFLYWPDGKWVKVQRNQLGWGEVFGKSGATYCINDLTWAAAPCSGYVGDGNVYTRTVTINEKLPSTTPARLVVGVVVTWKEGRKSFTSQLETELTNY
jgi:hypothetical protein